MDDIRPEKENADPGRENSPGAVKSSLPVEKERVSSCDTKPSREMSKLPTIDDFELLKPISRGAFGKVFLGRKKNDPGKLYAVKVMKKTDLINKNLIAQVTTERDALAMVHSPFVVQLFYSLQSKQNIYLVMEYLVGGDVKSMLAVYGYLGEAVSCFYAAEVTLALHHLHSHGIIHRDLKPDNMLISAQGHIKLTDFGLSKVSLDVGTPGLQNQPTPRSQLDKFRTPGQILSLKSSLMFSVPKPNQEQLTVSRVSKTRKSILGSCKPKADSRDSDAPMSPLVNGILLTPETHGSRVRSLHQRLTSHSMMSPRSPITSQAHSHTATPPVKSLTPTLQDSLQHSQGQLTADERRATFASQKRQSSTMCGKDCVKSQGDISLHSCSMSSTDEVFSSTRHDFKDFSDIAHTPGDKDCGVLNCLSHDKVSSRQESFTDETPQLHRTSESIWNSYAARNLRSFRDGSRSDISLSEDRDRHQSGNIQHEHMCTLPAVTEAPVETTSSSVSLTSCNSDGAEDRAKGENQDQSTSPKQPCRKRSYEVLVRESADHAGSGHTGLTQEVKVMFLSEEEIKDRSNSLTSSGDLQDVTCDQQEMSIDCDQDGDVDSSTTTHCKIRITSADGEEEDQETKSVIHQTLLERLASSERLRDNFLRPFLPEAYSSLLASSPETEPEDESANMGGSRRTEHQEPFKLHLPNLELPSEDKVEREHSPIETDTSAMAESLDSPIKPESFKTYENSSPNSHSCIVGIDEGVRDRSVEHLLQDPHSMGPPHTPCIRPCHKPPRNVEFKEQPRQVVAIRRMSFCDGPDLSSGGVDHENAMDISVGMSNCNTPERPVRREQGTYHDTPKSTRHPRRTPKLGVRRGSERACEEKERILGTPDYLAPEILLMEKHGPAVDWWALGVCLFEFLTGLPPFNDETPERVFTNILNRAISWPLDMMDEDAQDTVNSLLTMDPQKRPGAEELKKMPFFSHVDWNRLLETEAPFIPVPDDNMDTSYFEPKNTLQHLQISAVDL